MAKMNELAAVLDDIADCGERLIDAAETMADCGKAMIRTAEEIKEALSGPAESAVEKDSLHNKKETSSVPMQTESDAEPEVTYTKEDVRKALAEKSNQNHRQEVLDLLHKYGATKLKELDPKHYAAVIKEAGRIGHE